MLFHSLTLELAAAVVSGSIRLKPRQVTYRSNDEMKAAVKWLFNLTADSETKDAITEIVVNTVGGNLVDLKKFMQILQDRIDSFLLSCPRC